MLALNWTVNTYIIGTDRTCCLVMNIEYILCTKN